VIINELDNRLTTFESILSNGGGRNSGKEREREREREISEKTDTWRCEYYEFNLISGNA